MKKLLVALNVSALLLAQEKVDEVTSARLRSEELEHSQIMQTLHKLTDRYGPRVTGTPNHEQAAKWAVAEMTKWGLKNAHLEPWDFGRPGWLNESAEGSVVAPVRQKLNFEVLAWTPSTKGTVSGSTVEVDPPMGPPAPTPPAAAGNAAAMFGGGRGAPPRLGPTKDEFAKWAAENKGKVRGKIVLAGKAASIPVNLEPAPKRQPDERVKAMYDPANPNRGQFGPRPGTAANADPNRLTLNQLNEQVDAMLLEGGALLRVNDSARGEGVIVVTQNRSYDIAKEVPTVVLRNDDYGRIERLLADGEDVKLQFNIVNRVYPEGKTSYNVIAEIPGTDKADEVVMLGGHLDSWHAATGATDNAIGCSVMMEAARLITKLDLKPRRTVRVALWSGEEEGLLGSLAYVKEHFGTAEAPKPEWFKLDGYFNIDTGTGRIRGGSVFGPPEAADVVRPVMLQFAEWGVGGVNATSSRQTGGTDSTSFNNAGLPGIGMMQDPIEYGTMTHHTNLDTYERIIPDDVKKMAAIVAANVMAVANRDAMIPRFAKDKMPAPVPVPSR